MIVKSAAAIAKKWARVTPGRDTDYEEGVRNPRKDWEKETSESEPNYETGVQNAIKNKSFGKGVRKAGSAFHKAQTILKGLIRWPEGVKIAEKSMEDGMGPVVAVLEKTTLPPRFPTGDPRNIKRVEVVTEALHKLKTG